MAVAGLRLGALAIVVSLLVVLVLVNVVDDSEALFEQVSECVQNDNC
jgi:hypothetical protein